MTDRLLTAPEVAQYIRVPEATLKYWRTAGGGPEFIRLPSRQIRYRESAVEAWLDRGRVAS